MNWKRIWTGTLAAFGIFVLFDLSLILFIHHKMGGPPIHWLVMLGFLPPGLDCSFLVTWLYVLARPRLGPGPRTALIIGTIAFFLAQSSYMAVSFWMQATAVQICMFVLSWLKFVTATYVAGWQYIEKAP